MRSVVFLLLMALSIIAGASEAKEIMYTSSADQSAMFYAPVSKAPVPLIVTLHMCPENYKQKYHTLSVS